MGLIPDNTSANALTVTAAQHCERCHVTVPADKIELPDRCNDPDCPVVPIRGTFTALDMTKVASPTSPNPISRAHFAMVAELIRLRLPVQHVNPDPEDFEDVADYLLRVGAIVDLWLKAVGDDVQSSATVPIDMKVFTEQVRGALEGNATYEIDKCAAAVREERDEIQSAVRYGRTVGHIIKVLTDERGL